METRTTKYTKITENINKTTCIKGETILDIQKGLSEHNSKTCDFDEFQKYLKAKHKACIKLREHYEKKVFRKFKLNRHTNMQKSEAKMVKNFKTIYGNENEVTIIYGDYDNKGKNIKGKMPIAVKRLIKALKKEGYKIFLINEYNTSKKCHKCEHNTETFMTRKEPTNKKKRQKVKYKDKKEDKKKGTKEVKVWGLLRCENLECTVRSKNNQCRSIYNRDYNSCKNMIKIIEHLIKTGKRPKNYTRKEN